MILKRPSTLRRFFLIFKFWKNIKDTKTFIDFTDELHVCSSFDLKYVDESGYDAICKATGKKIEIKTTNYRNKNNGKVTNTTKFNNCGASKAVCNTFLFFDKITGQIAEFTSKEVLDLVDSNGMFTATINPKYGRGSTARTRLIGERFSSLENLCSN